MGGVPNAPGNAVKFNKAHGNTVSRMIFFSDSYTRVKKQRYIETERRTKK